jgi:hypothetical protein
VAPGEALPWHRDPFHRVSVVLSGDQIQIEFRDGSETLRVPVKRVVSVPDALARPLPDYGVLLGRIDVVFGENSVGLLIVQLLGLPGDVRSLSPNAPKLEAFPKEQLPPNRFARTADDPWGRNALT